MRAGDIFSSDRFRVTLNRGDSLAMDIRVRTNPSGSCGAVVSGEPVSLAGYRLSAAGKVCGTDRYVPMAVERLHEGDGTTPAKFSLGASVGDLGLAFEEGAHQVIEVRVEATRVDETFTVLKGIITMRDSASRVGA